VKPFSAKLRAGGQILGIGLSEIDILRMRNGEPVVLDLDSCGVGLWIKQSDGSREFLQPRDSTVVICAGDTNEDIGALLQVNLASLKRKT
jgi:hypothetical protein